MILAGVAALLLLAFGGGEEEQQPVPRPAQGTLTIHQQIIIRVPAGRPAAPPGAASLIRWEEHRGPRCIAWARMPAPACSARTASTSSSATPPGSAPASSGAARRSIIIAASIFPRPPTA